MKIYASTACAASRIKTHKSDDALDSAPADFDPTAHPIISRHFFGVEPLRQIGDVAVVVVDLKRQRQVARLHSLGPRPVLEALIEVAAGVELDTVLADYARLDLEVVVALGGDRFPPVPIHEVPL